MRIEVSMKGATVAELARAAQAVADFFGAIGMDPFDAAAGAFACEGWDVGGSGVDGPSEAETRAAQAWDEAQRIAVEAACSGWVVGPQWADIVLIRDAGDPPIA